MGGNGINTQHGKTYNWQHEQLRSHTSSSQNSITGNEPPSEIIMGCGVLVHCIFPTSEKHCFEGQIEFATLRLLKEQATLLPLTESMPFASARLSTKV